MFAVAIAALLSATPPPDPDLVAAERAYERADFENVLPHIAVLLQKQLPLAERRRATELEALTQTAFNHTDLAMDAFRRLLGLDAGWLPEASASPKVLSVFAEARRKGAIAPPPSLVLLPKEAAPKPAPLGVLAPEPLPPSPEEPRGITSRWWFWTGVGVLAAGAAAGGVSYYLTRPVVPSGTLGSGDLR